MRISVYTRHSDGCKHRLVDGKPNTSYRRCNCPKWLYCAEWPKSQRSAKTRSWDEASDRARLLEQGASLELITGKPVADAIDAYIKDMCSRHLSANHTAKITREMRELKEFAYEKSISTIRHWTLELLEQFRATWTCAARTKRNRQERLRNFFRYCERHEWIDRNPASFLSKIKVTKNPTVPFSPEEFKWILDAIETYKSSGEDQRDRARTMVHLLRWSGLRLGDASRLERDRLNKDGKLFLYMAKTGQPVYVPLPPKVAKMLRDQKNDNPKYFFWSGETNKNTPVYRWWETLKAIFREARVPHGHPHMFRDTFAIELLLKGVPLDQVSVLLGHSSIKVNAESYSPWVKARQEQLENSVKMAWH